MNPIEKYERRVKKIDSLVCVGLDSELEKLPAEFKKSRHPQFEFNKWIIDATHDLVSCYKPNSAFYEARGDVGMGELKMTIDYLSKNHPDIFTILDAKRADIGNTNEGYITSVYDWLGFDGITLHPYLGSEALRPFLTRKDRASIILCRTSNPGAGELQDLVVGEEPLWMVIARKVRDSWNSNNNCMLVVGATYPYELKRVREILPEITLLVPGVGEQGGDVESVVKAGLDSRNAGMIINSSRGIIFAESPRAATVKLRNQINKFRN